MPIFMGQDLPPFAFEGLDRLELEREDQQAMDLRLASDDLAIIPVWRNQILVNPQRDQMVTLARSEPQIAPMLGQAILLGDVAGRPHACLDISVLPPSDESGDFPIGPVLGGEPSQFVPPRAIAPALPALDMGMTALALHFTAWDKRTRFCGRCGGATQTRQGGASRICENHKSPELFFPRINPAVIMLIRDPADQQIILGRSPMLPPGMITILAGYLSPGETLIQAVKRETLEEVGIQVRDVNYYGSQPWAYSGSLMVGFSAVADSADLTVNKDELDEADWYTRDQIRELKAQGELKLPTGFSIARMMIDAWLDSAPEPA